MDYQIITNNPEVNEKFKDSCPVVFLEVSYRGILEHVRNMCQEGYKLLTHPLSGSVKPNETPYKSVMVSSKKQERIDAQSIEIIEKCLITYDKFPDLGKNWSQRVLDDFQMVDCTLISSGVDSVL